MSMNWNATILKAAALAVQHHDGQRRKITDLPYVIHPLRVAKIVSEVELAADISREKCIVAAILHDMLEDTHVEPETLAREFGQEIMTIVFDLTLDLGIPRAERIRKMLERAPKMTKEAQIVKLADRLDNMRDMGGRDPAFIKRYCEEASQIVRKLQGACPSIEAEIQKLIEQYSKPALLKARKPGPAA